MAVPEVRCSTAYEGAADGQRYLWPLWTATRSVDETERRSAASPAEKIPNLQFETCRDLTGSAIVRLFMDGMFQMRVATSRHLLLRI